MSKKYGALGDFLRRQMGDEVPMSFAEIERVIGSTLPPNSQHYPAWWSNSPWNNVMTKVWLDAGFKSERVDIKGRRLVFRRVLQSASGKIRDRSVPGMADETREFRPAETDSEKKQGRSPLWGALKGTFTIEPGYDLTSPMYSDEEWTQIEKEISDDWDVIEQGMSGKDK
jgi:hypothetical protein